MNSTVISNRFNTVKVRLSDSAVLAGTVSLLYALALIVSPRAFPELLGRVFEWRYFFVAMAVLLVATNEILFVLISRPRRQKLELLTPGYIAFLTIGVVFVFWLLVGAADLQSQISHLLVDTSNRIRDGISPAERLVYTYLTLVSGVFVPYLVVRLTQNYVSNVTSASTDENFRTAAAGR